MLVVSARSMPGRAIVGGGLAVLFVVQGWQATHVDHWVDVNTWRYARAASRFIGAARNGADRVVCTPDVNFGWVARYYDLLGPDDERRRAFLGSAADTGDGATWVMAYMFDPRSEGTIRKLVEDGQAGERSAAEREQIVAAVRDKGLAVMRLSADRCDTWVYDPPRDDFLPLETIVADRPSGTRTAAAADDSVR
jgi:hypothetical protein